MSKAYIYAVADALDLQTGGIYRKRIGSSGDCETLGVISRRWWRIYCAKNGDIYATVYAGDVYFQVFGTSGFVALEAGTFNYTAFTEDDSGNIYLTNWDGTTGKVYKRTGGTGAFVDQSFTSRKYTALHYNTVNSKCYFGVYQSGIYTSEGISDTLTRVGYIKTHRCTGITSTADGSTFAAYGNSNIYKQTEGVGDFNDLGLANISYSGLTTGPAMVEDHIYSSSAEGGEPAKNYIYIYNLNMYIWAGPNKYWRDVSATPYLYNITYDSNSATSGSVPTDSYDYVYNKTPNTKTNSGSLAKTNYVFIGWNTAANGSGTHFDEDSEITITGDITLYAEWEHSVTYDGNGETSGTVPVDSNTYKAGENATVLGNTGSLDKDYYQWTGWNTADDGSGDHYDTDDSLLIGSVNVTLYAEWHGYLVIHDGNSNDKGYVPTDSAEHIEGSEVTVLGNPYSLGKYGYKWIGWNTANDGSGDHYDKGDTFNMPASDVTLYAEWVALSQFDLIYDGSGNNSGTVPATAQYYQGEYATVSSNSGNLAKTGYRFAAWETAQGEIYYAGDKIQIDLDTTLYARWIEIEYRKCPIYLLDTTFAILAIFEDYESSYFSRNFYRPGKFCFEINYNKSNTSLIERDLFVLFGDDLKRVGIITDITKDFAEDKLSQKITVSGYELKKVFDRRIVLPPSGDDYYTDNDKAETVYKNFLTNQCVGSGDADRNFAFLQLGSDYAQGIDVELSARLKNVGDVLWSIAEQSDLGLYVYAPSSGSTATVDVIPGVDRRSSQATNGRAIFTIENDTAKSGTITDTDSKYKSLIYAAGQGVGAERNILSIYDGSEPTGLDRYEMYLDARDLVADEDITLRATNKLLEYGETVTLDADALQNSQLVLGIDYDLGDLCTINILGESADKRITEITEAWGPSKYEISLAFGKPVNTITSQLNQISVNNQQLQSFSEFGQNATEQILYSDDWTYLATLWFDSPSQIRKRYGTNAWTDANAYSKKSYGGGATISGIPSATNLKGMIGLSTAPDSPPSTAQPYYGMLCDSDGNLYRSINGTTTSLSTAYVNTDIVSVVYDGSNVIWYKNSTDLYTLNIGTGLTLYGEINIYSLTFYFSSVQFWQNADIASSFIALRELSSLSETGNYTDELALYNGNLYKWTGSTWTNQQASLPTNISISHDFLGPLEYPDDPAGTTYLNDAAWTGWTASGATLVASGGVLSATATGADVVLTSQSHGSETGQTAILKLKSAKTGKIAIKNVAEYTWTPSEIGAGIEIVYAICQLSSGRVLLGTGNSPGDGDVYYSDDNGVTWTPSEIGAGIEIVYSIFQLSSGRILIGTGYSTGDGDVYYSDDNGVTWTKSEIGAGIEYVLAIYQLASGRVVCGTGIGTGDGDVYYSDDNGVTWTKSEIGAGIEQVLAIYQLASGRVVCGTGSGTGDGDVYYSDDNGVTWTKSEIGAGIEYVLAIYQLASGRVVCGTGYSPGDGDVYYSDDNGVTWTKSEIGAGIEQVRCIYQLASGRVVCGTGIGTGDGDVYYSDDNGVTWTLSEIGAGIEVIYSIFQLSSGRILIGTGYSTGDGDVYYSDDESLFDAVSGEYLIATLLFATTTGFTIHQSSMEVGDVLSLYFAYVGTGAYLRQIPDNAGNGVHSTIAGAVCYQGKLIGDGVNDTVSATLDCTGSFSVAMWVKRVKASAEQRFFSIGGSATADRFSLGFDSSSNFQVERLISASEGYTTIDASPGTRRHIMVAYDGSNTYVYVSGVLVSTIAGTIDATNSAVIRLLASAKTTADLFAGVEIDGYYFSAGTVWGAAEARYLAAGYTIPQKLTAAQYWETRADDAGWIKPQEKKNLLIGWRQRYNSVDVTSAITDTADPPSQTIGGSYTKIRYEAYNAGILYTDATRGAVLTALNNLRSYYFNTPYVLLSTYWDTTIAVTPGTIDGYIAAYENAVMALQALIASTRATTAENNAKAAIPTTSPRNWGRYLDSAPTANATGDIYTRFSETSGSSNRGVFYWSGSAWTRTEDRKYIMQALSDISFIIAYKDESGTAIYGTAADYTSDSTTQSDFAFFQLAMIGYLEANEIAFNRSVASKQKLTPAADDALIYMGYDPRVPTWEAGKTVVVGYTIHGTTAGDVDNYYVVTTAGTTGTSTPTWPASGTVSDNGVVWTYVSAEQFQFCLATYLGTQTDNEVWMKHFLTKQMASGMIGLLLIGGLMSCAPILSAPSGTWKELTIDTYPVISITWSEGYVVALVDVGSYNKVYQKEPNSDLWIARAIKNNPSVSSIIADGARIYAISNVSTNCYIRVYDSGWSATVLVIPNNAGYIIRGWANDDSILVKSAPIGGNQTLRVIPADLSDVDTVLSVSSGQSITDLFAYGDTAIILAREDDLSAGYIYRVAAGTYAYTSITLPNGWTSPIKVKHVGKLWLIVDSDANIATSLDDGLTFTETGGIPSDDGSFADITGDDKLLFAVDDDGIYYRSNDLGKTWSIILEDLSLGDYLEYDEENGRLYAFDSGGCQYSDWTEAGAGIVSGGKSSNINWRKFSDGTMLQWGPADDAVFTSDKAINVAVVFPTAVPWIEAPTVMANSAIDIPSVSWVMRAFAQDITTAGFNLCVALEGSEASGTVTDLSWFAIGRWA